MFTKNHGRLPNLIRPKLLNDQITWRILFDRREFVTWACDKLEMKEQARLRCPEVLIPETLAVFNNPSEIATFNLTGIWVLKEISGSGQVYFGSENPNTAELADIAQLLTKWESKTKNRRKREWGYRNARKGYLIERRICTEELPETFQTMRKYAEQLGQGIDYVRIDFYSHNDEIYFGEFTPYVGAGLAKIEPREWELKMGSYWKLPSYKEARGKTR